MALAQAEGFATAPAHRVLAEEDLARILGVPPGDLPERCRERIRRLDFRYRELDEAERRAALAETRAALEADLPVSGPGRLPAWERGWGDILARFEAAGGDPSALVPHYFRPGLMRLEGRYVAPLDPRFELHFVAVLLAWLADAHLANAPVVYEFGCGPGHNLVELAGLLPRARFVGLDWAVPSQRIVSQLGRVLGRDIRARRFDMFAPDRSLALEPGSVALTMGAMEQLGERHEPFLGYLRQARPALCVHVEPIHELYDRADPFDDLAARYAEKRGYLRGLLPRLRELEGKGEAEILHVKRHLGSRFHDGWGTVIWAPRPGREEGD